MSRMNAALASCSTLTPAGFREVTPEALRSHLADVTLVDVREPDEYAGPLGHIDGASLVPLATVPSAAGVWRRDRTYVLVCRSGARSGRAAAALAAGGFKDVYNLTGGMIAWNDAGLPVTR
jgi:rhodanese-related sulfurtransferase